MSYKLFKRFNKCRSKCKTTQSGLRYALIYSYVLNCSNASRKQFNVKKRNLFENLCGLR